jgi:hypothetical protein
VVVDVGGGGGALLTCLLRKYPEMRGVLFEVPSVIERVSLAEEVAERIECVSGDALWSIPNGGAVYVLCSVLRCCDDERSVQLLAACRRAMHAEVRLLAMRDVVGIGSPDPLQGLNDLQAFTLYGSADRDPEAWMRPLAEAGLTLERIQPADPGYSWVVARVAYGSESTQTCTSEASV